MLFKLQTGAAICCPPSFWGPFSSCPHRTGLGTLAPPPRATAATTVLLLPLQRQGSQARTLWSSSRGCPPPSPESLREAGARAGRLPVIPAQIPSLGPRPTPPPLAGRLVSKFTAFSHSHFQLPGDFIKCLMMGYRFFLATPPLHAPFLFSPMNLPSFLFHGHPLPTSNQFSFLPKC